MNLPSLAPYFCTRCFYIKPKKAGKKHKKCHRRRTRKSDEDKHRLVVDEEAAAVVREIYRMRYSGMAYGKIAAVLNKKDILSPRWHWELHYGKKASANTPNFGPMPR